ncbi:hypothetical protein GE061_004306 [Apolygus lucorum]|uniref:Uncharacterized protein n=1 Tax=Apolygus lucorum TaxID=248454 RepID=A0A6A4J0W0_APOLU|nr:hypothetical protein GE061_004306 [Apolygus lucorum]
MRAVLAFVFAFAIVKSLDAAFSFESDIEKIPKSDEVKKKIDTTLKTMPIFHFGELRRIAIDGMKKVSVKAGDEIIKQGDKGDFLYVIDSGTYDVIMNKEKLGDIAIRTYKNKGLFGELSLLSHEPRSATVKAKSAGVLYSLDKKIFQHIQRFIYHDWR